jgi:hypothetical protein
MEILLRTGEQDEYIVRNLNSVSMRVIRYEIWKKSDATSLTGMAY